MIGQDLWQIHYQILLIILLLELTKLNVNMNIITKITNGVELNTKIAIAFLNTPTLKTT